MCEPYRASSRNYRHAYSITLKGQESSVKGHNYDFFHPSFPNLGHL